MMRTLLSLVAIATLFAVQPHAQTTQPQPQPQRRSSARAAKPTAIVNLNTASVVELQGLPGVGAKTAARIVDYRQKKGPFKKIEELMNVQGIGE